MKCNGAQKLLPLELEGQLKGKIKADFHAHLSGCPFCRETFDSMKGIEKELLAMPCEIPALGTAFEDRVMEKIRAKEARSPSRFFSHLFLYLSGAVFLSSFVKVMMEQPFNYVVPALESLFGLLRGFVAIEG